MNAIEGAIQKLKEFDKYGKGFYAGDGNFWIKCVDHEAAQRSGLRYIIFKDQDKFTLYAA